MNNNNILCFLQEAQKARFCRDFVAFCRKVSDKTKRRDTFDIRRELDDGHHERHDNENKRRWRRLSRMLRQATQMIREDMGRRHSSSYNTRHVAGGNIVDTDTKLNDAKFVNSNNNVHQNYDIMARKFNAGTESRYLKTTTDTNNLKRIDNYSNVRRFYPKKKILTKDAIRNNERIGNEVKLPVASDNHQQQHEKVLDSIYNLVYENSEQNRDKIRR